MRKHEKNVEKFYTTGSKVQQLKRDHSELHEEKARFLSFGYWEEQIGKYKEATKRLLEFFIENSGIKKTERILNVACGYGAETFAYYHHFKPEEVIGVDVARVHTDYANWKSGMLNLSDQVKFQHADAVNPAFPDESFSHIMGIEGPAHFNTREQFFKSSMRLLKPGGELLLTDIIIGERYTGKNPLHKLILKIAAVAWVTPKENQVKEAEYRRQLENAGFDVIFLHRIGDKVYPGYSSHFKKDIIKESIAGMGLLNTLGIATIGKMLGYLYKHGIIDYIYVKARKK